MHDGLRELRVGKAWVSGDRPLLTRSLCVSIMRQSARCFGQTRPALKTSPNSSAQLLEICEQNWKNAEAEPEIVLALQNEVDSG